MMLSRAAKQINDAGSLRRSFHLSRSVLAAPKVQNFINGKFEDSKATEWIDVLNPATQEVVCQVPQSTPEELQRAEEGAKEAFKKWKEVPVQQRQVSIFKCISHTQINVTVNNCLKIPI